MDCLIVSKGFIFCGDFVYFLFYKVGIFFIILFKKCKMFVSVHFIKQKFQQKIKFAVIFEIEFLFIISL